MKVRDLLIVAAFVCGVVACSYRAQIRKYFEPAIAPVEYYVDAPAREKELREELAAAEKLAAVRAQHVAVLSEEKERAEQEVASLSQRLSVQSSAATLLRQETGRLADQLQSATSELADLRAYRARFEALCQRIRALNGDAHAIEQLVAE
jgi:septal ring factor EnvC (AmiA/AmiB activator)